MSKNQMVVYLMEKHNVSQYIAEEACRANDWDLMMASGELRDQA